MTEDSGFKCSVIIPSAGRGARMGAAGKKNKNYLPLLSVPVLVHTLRAFSSSALVSEIVVVVPPSDIDYCQSEMVEAYGIEKVSKIIAGGSERQDSVSNGIGVVSEEADIIVVHDGARSLVTTDIIERTIKAAYDAGAAIAAVPVKDTIKEVGESGFVLGTLPRERLMAVQTPQAFRADILRRAYEEAKSEGFLGTDSSSLVERLGVSVVVVEGSYENIKITTAEDLHVAERILKSRGRGA